MMDIRKSLALAIAVSGSSAPALAGNWSGPYLGITGGGGWGEQGQHGGILFPPSSGSNSSISSISSSTFSSQNFTDTDGRYGISGGLVGGSVGYNWQYDKFVYGLEGDGSWADISGSGTCGLGSALPHACGGGIDALGTVRGRVGIDLGPAGGPFFGNGFLLFAAGGLAVGEVKAWDALFGTSGHETIAGWTVGGGIEAKISPNWSVRLEYLHVDLGDHGIFSAIPPIPEHVSTRADLVRVGVSYHFDLAPPPVPVIAKY